MHGAVEVCGICDIAGCHHIRDRARQAAARADMAEWRQHALGALDDARADVLQATEPVLMAIITVTDADLRHGRPVSFYGNIGPSPAFGEFLAYCAARIKGREAAP